MCTADKNCVNPVAAKISIVLMVNQDVFGLLTIAVTFYNVILWLNLIYGNTQMAAIMFCGRIMAKPAAKAWILTTRE